jgi:type VI protein secretion system component VasF
MAELDQRRGTPALRRQLAAIYLACLKLGFCGEWRGDAEQLAAYEQRLRRWLPPAAHGQHAFPQAYAHSASGPREERLAPLRRFWRWSCAGLALYLALSLLAWLLLSQPLSTLLAELTP